jgi:hypothetical protein
VDQVIAAPWRRAIVVPRLIRRTTVCGQAQSPGVAEKLYLAGAASAFITVNGEASTQLDLNGSSFGLPTRTVIPVELNAGINTIQF